MRVLLASDGSADSRRATRWLRDLQLPSDTKVSVLTVATLTEPPRDAQTMSQLRDSVVARARQTAEQAAKILRPRWPDVETLVMLGDARVEISHVAEEARVDMITVGARNLGRLERSLVGSTSLSVARYAPCPVVVVQGRPRPVRRILVAVDASEASRGGLRFLSILDLVRDTQVSLLHVLSAPVGRRRTASASAEGPCDEDRRKLQADADAMLADAAAILADAGCQVERLVSEGDAAREIVRTARNCDVDLVVLGARGLRTLGRLLLGSVSETVLHHAGRPVAIVREQ